MDILFAEIDSKLQRLLDCYFSSESNYHFIILPAPPETVKSAWYDSDIFVIQSLNDLINLNVIKTPIFSLSCAKIGVYSGLFIYGIQKQLLSELPPALWGGHMVAQIYQKKFSAKQDCEKFWAGTKPYLELQLILDKLQDNLANIENLSL